MKQRQTKCINLSQAKAFADINKLARSVAKQFSFILPQQDGTAIIFDMIHTAKWDIQRPVWHLERV